MCVSFFFFITFLFPQRGCCLGYAYIEVGRYYIHLTLIALSILYTALHVRSQLYRDSQCRLNAMCALPCLLLLGITTPSLDVLLRSLFPVGFHSTAAFRFSESVPPYLLGFKSAVRSLIHLELCAFDTAFFIIVRRVRVK